MYQYLDVVPEHYVLAVNDEVEGRVDHDEQVIDNDNITGPSWEFFSFSIGIENGHQLINGDENFTHVTQKEQNNNSKQNQSDVSIAPSSRSLLRRIERHRAGGGFRAQYWR